jgi:putative membrane protein
MTRRWPGWVYGEGDEPDYRFSFANERTFLAWIRTALALVAAGVALDVLGLSVAHDVERVAAMTLVALGVVIAAVAWLRWALAERAMRRARPLPSFGSGLFFAVAVAAAMVLLLVASL